MPDEDEACELGLTIVFSSPEAKWDARSASSASGTEVEESEFAVGARKVRVDAAEVDADDAEAEEEEAKKENAAAAENETGGTTVLPDEAAAEESDEEAST